MAYDKQRTEALTDIARRLLKFRLKSLDGGVISNGMQAIETVIDIAVGQCAPLVDADYADESAAKIALYRELGVSAWTFETITLPPVTVLGGGTR
jgi:hypothetical protein